MKIQHKERPILFSGPMVRAIQEGRKTQTRRVVWHPLALHAKLILGPHDGEWWDCVQQDDTGGQILCPYGKPGDRLWVRETWRCHGGREYEYQKHQPSIRYRADSDLVDAVSAEWRRSIHMPRWASRITLEIVSVRVEMLQDISEEDAKAEGADFGFWHPEQGVFSEPTDEEDEQNSCYRDGFGFIWESINGPGSWDLNPWVWVVEFKEVKA